MSLVLTSIARFASVHPVDDDEIVVTMPEIPDLSGRRGPKSG
jgi:hypothetical protein